MMEPRFVGSLLVAARQKLRSVSPSGRFMGRLSRNNSYNSHHRNSDPIWNAPFGSGMIFTAAAVGTATIIGTVSTCLLLDQESEHKNQDKKKRSQTGSYWNRIPLAELSHNIAMMRTTSCDSSAWLSPSSSPLASPTGLRRLRRQATIQKLEETATLDSLEANFDVHWHQEPLGQGAYGSVWAATDRATGERVAVKKIPKQCTDSLSFQREMEALLLLREHGGHPHTTNLRANYEEHGAYYLVMDLVGGRELFEQLCEEGPYSEMDAAVHMREVASALAFLVS